MNKKMSEKKKKKKNVIVGVKRQKSHENKRT